MSNTNTPPTKMRHLNTLQYTLLAFYPQPLPTLHYFTRYDHSPKDYTNPPYQPHTTHSAPDQAPANTPWAQDTLPLMLVLSRPPLIRWMWCGVCKYLSRMLWGGSIRLVLGLLWWWRGHWGVRRGRVLLVLALWLCRVLLRLLPGCGWMMMMIGWEEGTRGCKGYRQRRRERERK